jgi:hypothetical protein
MCRVMATPPLHCFTKSLTNLDILLLPVGDSAMFRTQMRAV